MTAEERAQWEAFKADQEKKKKEEARKEARQSYAELVDAEIAGAVPLLRQLSEKIKATKDKVFGDFAAVLDMKADVIGLKEDGQYSHTFTNSDSTMRITLGVNTVDGYRDTVEDGIGMVKKYIESLATDEKTQALVKAVLRLMARDNSGNLKASRVLQLRKMAEESQDEVFLEGVKIIEESYQPTTTGRYIRAQYRDETTKGTWRNIPLNITDVDLTE